MKRELATIGNILSFIENRLPNKKVDTIELEVYDEFGKIKRIFMDQVSIKTISEYPSGERIVLSIDMRSNKYLQECINIDTFTDDESDEIEIEDDEEKQPVGSGRVLYGNEYVDMEESEEICNSNEINKEEYKININDAVKSVKKAAEVISSMYPSEKDFCTDEWPGNKYIITPDQC